MAPYTPYTKANFGDVGLNNILHNLPKWSLLVIGKKHQAPNPGTTDPHIETGTILFTKIVAELLRMGISPHLKAPNLSMDLGMSLPV